MCAAGTQVVAQDYLSRQSEYSTQTMANIAWASRAAAFPSRDKLYEAIAADCATRMQGFNPQELSTLLLAFKNALPDDPQLGLLAVRPAPPSPAPCV